MPNFLQQLLGGAPAVNSSEQLAAAQRRSFSPAMERQARANGFNSAEEFVLWQQQRKGAKGGSVAANKLPNAEAAMALHPKSIMEYVLDQWQGAQRR